MAPFFVSESLELSGSKLLQVLLIEHKTQYWEKGLNPAGFDFYKYHHSSYLHFTNLFLIKKYQHLFTRERQI